MHTYVDLLYSVANNRPMQMALDLNVSVALIKCDCAIVGLYASVTNHIVR